MPDGTPYHSALQNAQHMCSKSSTEEKGEHDLSQGILGIPEGAGPRFAGRGRPQLPLCRLCRRTGFPPLRLSWLGSRLAAEEVGDEAGPGGTAAQVAAGKGEHAALQPGLGLCCRLGCPASSRTSGSAGGL